MRELHISLIIWLFQSSQFKLALWFALPVRRKDFGTENTLNIEVVLKICFVIALTKNSEKLSFQDITCNIFCRLTKLAKILLSGCFAEFCFISLSVKCSKFL